MPVIHRLSRDLPCGFGWGIRRWIGPSRGRRSPVPLQHDPPATAALRTAVRKRRLSDVRLRLYFSTFQKCRHFPLWHAVTFPRADANGAQFSAMNVIHHGLHRTGQTARHIPSSQ